MEVYSVIWASSACDDDGNVHAFSGVHGIYMSEESAKVALEECKQEIVNEAYECLDPDNEFPDVRDEVKVLGAVENNYFEVDYTMGTEPVEIQIQIVKTSVQNQGGLTYVLQNWC